MSIYNQISGSFSIESKRQQLIDALFPYGFPTETIPLTFTANSIVADHVPRIGINNSLFGDGATADLRIKFGTRYCHPTAGTNRDTVLLWINGHESATKYDDAYPASVTNGGKITHAQRVQFHGLPSNAANALWKVPLLNGIGIIEQSGLGSYLNAFLMAYSNDSTQHTPFVSELGAEAVGYFLYPHIVAINTAIAAGKRVAVGGFSGGGWATLLLAAIDPRIKLAVCQSGWTGTVANGATSPGGVNGDGEQLCPELYAIANPHELAVMGAAGNGRRAYHVWNTSTGGGADTVFPLTTAEVQALNAGGLPKLAAGYGGELRFMGFAGVDDPCTNFGAGTGTATYTSIATAVASCLNAAGSASGADPGAFSYTGSGHHVMNQTIDFAVKAMNTL